MELWREAKAEGTALNVIVYSSLIDPQALAGHAEEGAVLLEGTRNDGLTGDAITVTGDAITYSTVE